jgi:hypothetical protein
MAQSEANKQTTKVPSYNRHNSNSSNLFNNSKTYDR